MNSEMVLSHLSFALLLLLLLPISKLPRAARLVVFAAAIFLGTVPYAGLSLATYVHSLTDDLAISTLLLLGWVGAAKVWGFQPFSAGQQRSLALCFGAIALLLYPASLGLSSFDPYRLGYSPRPLFGIIFAISVLFWWYRQYLGAAMLTLATMVFTLHIKASNNYFDYIIDPLLGLYCWGFLAISAGQFFWQKITVKRDSSIPFGLSNRLPWKPTRGVNPAPTFSPNSYPGTARFTMADLDRSIEIMQTVRNQSMWEIGSSVRRLPAHRLRTHCHRINQKSGHSDFYRSSR